MQGTIGSSRGKDARVVGKHREAMAKRIPMIKFPSRRGPAPVASAPPKVTPSPTSSTTNSSAGAASIQPKRPPVSKEEIEAVLLGGVVG
ncbi:hypothetical protein R1flu_029013 [Riccia fluitans]|uniref:Uncharacterized protein n=1 Tax=Riccia fluitans TaxID=41844 RepID=A0ABD1XNE3_9MARC